MEGARPVRSKQDESTEILRAKYLDYCSAQLAEILLYLTPDEIYLIAQKAAREAAEATCSPSFERMVQIATRWLSRRVALPPFEVWAADYRRHPDRYQEYFMGLWEAEGEPQDV